MKSRQLWLDGVVGSQLRDTQGEMLNVEGADISDLERGAGRWNDNHGKGFFNSLGIITEAKKIQSEKDCANDRHKYYWDKVKAPFIYAKGYLHNDEDHPNAKAAAAILRNIHKADTPLRLKASVEGGVIQRGISDQSLLARTKIHSVAITFTPANQATLLEPLNLDKSMYDEEHDKELINSVLHLAETNIPSFRHVARVASAQRVKKNIAAIREMMKSLNEDPVEKGIKEAVAGAALAGSMAMAPAKISAAEPKPKQVQMQQQVKPTITHKQMVESIRQSNPELYALAQVESSGGKKYDDHDTMTHGMHKGQTAAGPWGHMPNTVAYTLKISPKLAKKYQDISKLTRDVKGNHQKISEAVNQNPQLALDLAKTLFGHLKRLHGNDLDKVVHSWHHGINGTNKLIQRNPASIKDTEYVKKFHSNYNDLNKGLTAGYGGGSPTDSTGGLVFQTESLEGGNRFKYVTCDDCGHEQIYAKHQVKCRKCSKPWSLAKLYKIMSIK
jgi:ribosomal protein L12E/L44/L45/RPP1/RPP2